LFNSFTNGLIHGSLLGLKSCILIFLFIWVRASFPRIRFDQLMSYCWTILLPIVIAFVILVPCVVYSLSLIPINFYLV
jgi:NADH-ubiquinone oxidoreductase chain 1